MHLPTILAVLSDKPIGGPFNEMLSLIGIAAIIVAIFRGIKSLRSPQAPVAPPQTQPVPLPAPAPAPPRPAPAPVADDGIAPEIIAVIAAAVATATTSSRRIVSVKSQDPMWEKAGRQSILTSHRIR